MKSTRSILWSLLLALLLLPALAWADVVDPNDKEKEKKDDGDGGCAVTSPYAPASSAAPLVLGAALLIGAARRKRQSA
jgi:MYXO-CTERM domain-containing protein